MSSLVDPKICQKSGPRFSKPNVTLLNLGPFDPRSHCVLSTGIARVNTGFMHSEVSFGSLRRYMLHWDVSKQ